MMLAVAWVCSAIAAHRRPGRGDRERSSMSDSLLGTPTRTPGEAGISSRHRGIAYSTSRVSAALALSGQLMWLSSDR